MLLVVWVATRLQRQRAPSYCRDVTDTVAVICQSQWRRSDGRWNMERCCDCTEQSESKVGQVYRHLRWSYDADFKIMVVNAAEAPNNCQPAEKYRVTECNVRRWRVQKDRLKNANSKRKAYRGPPSGRFQETDRRVCEFVIEKQILVIRVFFWRLVLKRGVVL